MGILSSIGITVFNYNDLAPGNAPDQQEQHQVNVQEGGEVCKSDGIVCPCKANNIHIYFTYFWKYTKAEVLRMSKLELFLVLSPVGYLHTILILERKSLKIP